MKIVLIYWGYEKIPYFGTEPIKRSAEDHAELQVRNMLDLGYKQDDIIFATNFEWEFQGIKTIPLKRSAVPKDVKKTATKMFATKELIEEGYIQSGDVYWIHDLDVVQNITFSSPMEMNYFNLGLVPFSSSEINIGTCSYFVRAEAYSKIDTWCGAITSDKLCDEKTLNRILVKKGIFKENVDYVKLNRTYGYNYKADCQFWKNLKKHNVTDAGLKNIHDGIQFPLHAVDFNYMPYRPHFRSWKNKVRTNELSERLMKILYAPLNRWP